MLTRLKAGNEPFKPKTVAFYYMPKFKGRIKLPYELQFKIYLKCGVTTQKIQLEGDNVIYTL